MLASAALIAIAAAGCGQAAHSEADPPSRTVPVETAVAVRGVAPVELRAIGRARAVRTVTIAPQVSGQVNRVWIGDGDQVKAGQVLFTLDPRPFRAALAQAAANLARDRARAGNAAALVKRYGPLVPVGAVAADEAERAEADRVALAATVRADKAAVETARLHVTYTTMRAPLSGRAGAVLVHAGNVVTANTSKLLTINQLEPIYAEFSVPEQMLPAIRRASREHAVTARVHLPGAERPATGPLRFVDNQIDPQTNTIVLRAELANHDHRVWPGQFLDVRLTLAKPEAVLVPSAALQLGQHGSYVWVVRADDTVTMRRVETTRTVGDQGVIEDGLSAGERVVTDGQLQLREGTKVHSGSAGSVTSGDGGQRP